MKNLSRILVVLSVIILLTSCGERRKLARDMKRFVASAVVLPDDMERIYDRSISRFDLAGVSELKFIVYYDSLDCSSCAVAHLVDLLPLYEKFEGSKVDVMTVFSPRSEEIEDIKVELMIADQQFPVYIDTNGSFARLNHDIPTDNRFDYFLIGGDGKPKFVGNPLVNEQLMAILDDILFSL